MNENTTRRQKNRCTREQVRLIELPRKERDGQGRENDVSKRTHRPRNKERGEHKEPMISGQWVINERIDLFYGEFVVQVKEIDTVGIVMRWSLPFAGVPRTTGHLPRPVALNPYPTVTLF